MPHIDTLATARRLEQAGLPTEHARAVSEAIADAIRDSQPDWSALATKEFVREEMQALRTELRGEIQALRTELRGEMQTLRTELRAEFQTQMKDLELRIAERLRSQMLWFFTVQTALLGIAVVIIKLYP
jgi:hypothetical protein